MPQLLRQQEWIAIVVIWLMKATPSETGGDEGSVRRCGRQCVLLYGVGLGERCNEDVVVTWLENKAGAKSNCPLMVLEIMERTENLRAEAPNLLPYFPSLIHSGTSHFCFFHLCSLSTSTSLPTGHPTRHVYFYWKLPLLCTHSTTGISQQACRKTSSWRSCTQDRSGHSRRPVKSK